MNLKEIREDVTDYMEKLHQSEVCYGRYCFEPDGVANFYATCDASIIRTIMGEDLNVTLTSRQRGEWISHINSFVNESGEYEAEKHSLYHRNGMAVGALGPLGGKMKHRFKGYSAFDDIEKVEAWLEQMDWYNVWGGSHYFWGGMHCYSLSADCTDEWRQRVFDWLDNNLDPDTGWWRKGVAHSGWGQGLGGAAHIWPIYQHHHRAFPCPESAIDSILSMQKSDGKWMGASYLNLDALYGLACMRSFVPEYRKADIRKSIERFAQFFESFYPAYFEQKPDLHHVLAQVGAVGLLNQLDPERFPDSHPWTDIFSDLRLYQVAAVEVTK